MCSIFPEIPITAFKLFYPIIKKTHTKAKLEPDKDNRVDTNSL